MTDLIISLATKYPQIIIALSVIGALRAINKPLFSFLHAFVLVTPTKVDDEALEVVEKSRVYAAIVYVLDWCASVKIAPTPVVAPAEKTPVV